MTKTWENADKGESTPEATPRFMPQAKSAHERLKNASGEVCASTSKTSVCAAKCSCPILLAAAFSFFYPQVELEYSEGTSAKWIFDVEIEKLRA